MKAKEILGLVLTVLSFIILAYELLYVGLTTGSIGVKGQVVTDSMLISAGFLIIILGPMLWLGEVPTNIKKLIEAKTGRRIS